ncbi:hypothetical protein L1049_016022 [Liquidambar formosana]|uniref:Uncharacterized protein n=1 Tax=Liquidambar formosana TaxID=63359 RepID=A0AAP0X2A8_LIQFO
MELWSYRPTPKQLAMTVVCFVTGASLFAVGAHLSLAPKQARTNTKARNDFHQTTPQEDDIINSLVSLLTVAQKSKFGNLDFEKYFLEARTFCRLSGLMILVSRVPQQ